MIPEGHLLPRDLPQVFFGADEEAVAAHRGRGKDRLAEFAVEGGIRLLGAQFHDEALARVIDAIQMLANHNWGRPELAREPVLPQDIAGLAVAAREHAVTFQSVHLL